MKKNKKLSFRKETVRLLRVSVFLAKYNWEIIFCGHYRSIFNYCDVIGLQSYRILPITPFKVTQGHRCR